MDKYEYKVRADEIKSLIQERKYREAVEIADTIDWRNVRNSMMLCTISDLYKICKRYEDSRDVLLLAYQRNPSGRLILYSLCELSLKLNDVAYAVEYYKEYAQVAPKDPGLYILKYKLYTAQGVGTEERIQVLEDLQQLECKEKWMYELAYLYHTVGYGEKCVEECNQIILYFGEGKYVIKALELKQIHEPLSGEQDILYRRLTSPDQELVRTLETSKFNTIDLQKELAESLKDVLYDDSSKKTAPEPVIEEIKETVEEPEPEPVYVQEEETVETQYEPSVEEETVTDATVSYEPVRAEEQHEDTEETKIFNVKDVETALNNKESSFSYDAYRESEQEKVKIEPLPDERNTGRVVFPHYDEMVSLEGDGQISLVVPEEEMVDKQITGQISIEDVLQEWERMKNASEKKWREDVRKRVLAQTDGIFKTFDETARGGLLERLEVSLSENENVELTKEETAALVKENEEQGGLTIDVEEPETIITEEDIDKLSQPEIPVVPIIPAETVNVVPFTPQPLEDIPVEKEEVKVEVEPWKPEPVRNMHEIILEDEEPEKESAETEPIEVAEPETAEATEASEPTAEELTFDRTPFIESEEETVTEEIIEAEPEITEAATEEPSEAANDNIEDDYLFKFAEAGEERDRLDSAVTEAVVEVAAPSESETPTEVKAEETVEPEAEAEVEVTVEPEPEVKVEETAEAEVKIEETAEAETEVEETPEPEGETVTEAAEPEAEEAVEPETPEEPGEIAETEEEVTEEEAPAEPVIADNGLTEEQNDRFECFIYTESGIAQLKYALENMTMEAGTGNMIIGSEDVDSAIDLGKCIITELSERGEISGKVAKIKASTLNAKDAFETLKKLDDGALIIQDAHELRPETLDAIRKTLASKDKKMFVVLTVPHMNKHRFITENEGFLESFTINYDIEALDDTKLVEFAKKYAYQREFGIDEMGLLALHTRIDEKQTNSHSVTVTEVRDIVDAAIEHACKRNVGHFFETVVGKRYDANDMIVLREKDFQIK